MINGKKVVALIPLRGGSKSIPKKNIKIIAGKPLCAYTIRAARQVSKIDEVIVSTDDEEIISVVKEIDAGVRILKRPAALATDSASTESVMIHLSKHVKFEILITIQATSPLTTAEDLKKGLTKFIEEKCDSLLTGVRSYQFFWTGSCKAVNYDYLNRPRRQDFKGWIIENGAFYITAHHILKNNGSRLGGKIGILEMPSSTGIEIDEPDDWPLVEFLLLQQKTKILVSSLTKIKLLVVDVDGTLTDGGMYYSSKGEQLKKFNTRDAKGLELIRNQGVEVAIITSEDSDIVRARAEKLGITSVYCGVKTKIELLKQIIKERKLDIDDIAFIGDDLNDLDCLREVGFSACPADAVTAVKIHVSYVCNEKGGEGAVREVCELFLKIRS